MNSLDLSYSASGNRAYDVVLIIILFTIGVVELSADSHHELNGF